MTDAGAAAPRRTSLAETHEALGATMTDFAGWWMPLRYGSEIAEHKAVRTAAGLFDLGHMGQIDVRGLGAGAALDYALVGELSSLRYGKAKYSMLCASDGGVLDDLVVYRLSEDHYLVIANAANRDVVSRELTERAAEFDATVDLRDETQAGLIAIQGPAAADIVEQAIGESVDGLAYYACRPAAVAAVGDAPVLLARTGYTGEDGFELFCRASDAPAIWSDLMQRGQGAGLVPTGLSCRDSLRLEAGMPLYGHELTSGGDPYEAGLGRVVKLDKPGGFVGDAALHERSVAPARVLVGLRCGSRRVPRAQYAVLGPGGAQVGEVTSGAPSPTLGYPIALAYVAPEFAAEGTELAVDIRGSAEPAVVVPRPFYRRG